MARTWQVEQEYRQWIEGENVTALIRSCVHEASTLHGARAWIMDAYEKGDLDPDADYRILATALLPGDRVQYPLTGLVGTVTYDDPRQPYAELTLYRVWWPDKSHGWYPAREVIPIIAIDEEVSNG